MIALLVAAAWVYENIEPGQSDVSIQAILPFEENDPVDPAAAETLAAILPKDIEGYSRRDIMTVTDGVPPKCEVEGDHLRISLTVPAGNLTYGLGLMEAMLLKSRLTDAKIKEAVQNYSPGGYWSAALRPYTPDFAAMLGSDVLDLYRRLGDPDRVKLIVGGEFEAGKAQELWEKRTANWPPVRNLRHFTYQPKVRFRSSTPERVSIVEFAGPEIPAKDAALSTRLLAVVALGTGKGSSLFRVVRGTLAASYRQEALMIPTAKGWEPRLAVAFRATGEEVAASAEMREALLKDIDSWDEPELKRAQGMTEGVLMRMPELSPLSLWRGGPVSNSLEGRTFLKGYWQLKTGRTWDPKQMSADVNLVTLAELKEAAKSMVDLASVRIIPGG